VRKNIKETINALEFMDVKLYSGR